MRKFKVLFQRVIRGEVHANMGDVVYPTLMCDYGLANDDTRATGVEHITVTLNEDGSNPGFTIPLHHLEEIK